MRILLTASTFPLHPDDALPGFVFGLARALAEHDDVTVLAPGAPGAAEFEEWSGVRVRRFPYFWPRRFERLAYAEGMDTNLRRSWLARLELPTFLAAEWRATRRAAVDVQAEVVNSHWLLPQGLTAALARGRSARFRHVVTLHGGDAHLLGQLPMASALARFVGRRADAFLAASSAARERLDTALGRPSRAVVQPMGADTARFRSALPLDAAAEGLPGGYLLFVGRLQEIKGVSVLLRALARVRARHPELGLLIVGYGEREATLRAEADELGLASAVRFGGARGSDGVAQALRGCRACVVPSLELSDGRVEGMPTVVVEALAGGARLVATATGGIAEVVRDGETGWLCPPGDAEALAAAILRALDAPDASAVAARGQAEAERFDWTAVARRYREVFASVSSSSRA
ncbi:MAG: glycosyltransferase [Myxococcota bacterium]|nr:glycosyltransferase [Myxococcota bacterium]